MAISTLFDSSSKEDVPSNEDWNYEFVGDLTAGLDASKSGRAMDANRLQVAKNVRFYQSSVVVDFGYVTFGQAILGTPRLTYEYFKTDGSSFLVLITNNVFYLWNATNLQWEFVSDGTSTTLSAAASANDTSVSVTDITGFSDGDLVGIRLDDGTQFQTTVNGAPSGSTITLTDAITGAASIGNIVLHGTALNGSDDIQPTVATWAGTDKMYFTNGMDAPKVYDGTEVGNISGLPANTKARLITIHINHLIVMNLEESGTAYPQRERWTEPGSDSNWNTSVNYQDHYDTEDHIIATEELGTYLIIYKERSIIRQEYVGSLDQTWNWITTVGGEGAVGADCVMDLGEYHVFWGNSNIYEYRGGFDLNPIGDEIFDLVFSVATGDLNPERKDRVFVVYIEEFDEGWFFYANGSNDFPQKLLRVNFSNNAWSIRDFSFDVTGYGFYSRVDRVTWETAVGTWAQQTGPWSGTNKQAQSPTIHLLDGTANRVYEYDFSAAHDNGADIPYEVVTKDWFVPNRELRFNRYDFRIRGSDVRIELSVDGGENYVTLGTISPGNVFTTKSLWQQIVGRMARFRFTGSADFGLQELGFSYKRETLQG